MASRRSSKPYMCIHRGLERGLERGLSGGLDADLEAGFDVLKSWLFRYIAVSQSEFRNVLP